MTSTVNRAEAKIIARSLLKEKLIVVISGTSDNIADDLTFLKEHVDPALVKGVIINKVHDIEDFKATHLEYIESLGHKILGIVPFEKKLTHLTVSQVAETLMAKVIASCIF